MSYDPKRIGGLFSGIPSYKILNNKPKSEMAVELVQQEETKYWSMKPLYTLAFLQMIFGVFLCAAQVFNLNFVFYMWLVNLILFSVGFE